MPYALNTKKGTTVNHPEAGELVGGIAVPVSDSVANQLKHTHDVVIFDSVLQVEVKEPGNTNIKE